LSTSKLPKDKNDKAEQQVSAEDELNPEPSGTLP
jgi:hypothetical protein